MLSQELASDLECSTNELLAAAGPGVEELEPLIRRRADVVARIAQADPASWSPGDLTKLSAALRNGDAALERLVLLRRHTAAQWQRSNRMSHPAPVPAPGLSLSA